MKKLVQSVVFLLSVAVTARAQTPSLTNERHIISPAGGQSSLADSRLSSVTGYLKIRLPQAWSNTTMKMTIDIFEYSTNRSRTLNLSGYNYESGGWYNVSANQQSSDDEAITVNFGYDGSKCAIYISKGTKGAATQWEYPSVLVRDVMVSYSNIEVEKWNTGWQVGFTTTLGTNIQNVFVPSKSALTNERHIVSPVGGQSSLADSRLSGVTGYLKIRLPQAWSNTAMKITVDIFEYGVNRSRTLNLSGYNYESGVWINVSANQQSSDDEAITVNFGYDGSKCAIYISKGTKGAATQWESPSVLVRDVIVSYSNTEVEKWSTGWQVGFTTTLGTNIQNLFVPSKSSLINERHIVSPVGGQSSLADSRLSSVTGYLKITLPQAWSNTTMKMTIDIFEYSTNRSRILNMSGYNYEAGGWYNVSANQQSSDDEAITVNFGYDGSKCAIYLSKGIKGAATQWEYPSVLVRDVVVSYSNIEAEKWNNGWQVGFTTTIGTNLLSIVASPSWQGISESTTGVVKVAGSVGIGTTSTPIGSHASQQAL